MDAAGRQRTALRRHALDVAAHCLKLGQPSEMP
jgi:hypothetical protein